MTRTLGIATALTFSLAGLAAAPAASSAQQADGRWLAWLGCWESTTVQPGGLVCVTPTDGGIEQVTFFGSEVVDTRTLSADDVERTRTMDGCTIAESARFSDNGKRVYVRSYESCGDQDRTATTLFAITPTGEWLELKSVAALGQSVALVKRYRAARLDDERAAAIVGAQGRAANIETARMAAGTRLTVDDIIEASAAVDQEAVKALIAEMGEPLRLDAEALLRLADAGVSPEVIDVAIAVSYPERFQVASQDAGGDRLSDREWDRRYADCGFGRYGFLSFYDPLYYDPYSCGRYGYGYGYGRYGYSNLGYGGYYWSRPTVIVVTDRDEDDSVRGRVVKGRGWTRGSTGSNDNPSSGSIRASRGSSGSATASRPSTSRGSTETRRAKPRGGG